jgi:MoxR-vWA-beta-propeller ternary system domain bpX5
VTSVLPVRPRREPLVPCAAAAEGAAAVRLAHRLLALDDEALARLSGVSAPDLLAVFGPEVALPWVEGIRYFGRDPEAPSLLLPTAVVLSVPAPLLERALLAAAGGSTPPLAVLLDPLRLVPMGLARPVDRARLQVWIGGAA